MTDPALPAYAQPLDRRETIRWVAVVSGLLAGGGYLLDRVTAPGPPLPPGYGVDPKLSDYYAPWPRLLTGDQRLTVGILCDHVLPAEGKAPSASMLGIFDLIDEWISAPYPAHVADRDIILPGLNWIDVEARARGNKGLDMASPAVRRDVLDAWTGEGPAATQPAPKNFYDRVRRLTIGAYYTTEAGFADIGYIGNQALTAFPAISGETQLHLEAAFARLGL